VSFPAANAPTPSNTSWIVTSRPRNVPGNADPPYVKTPGTFTRAMAMREPGIVLSHPAHVTRASYPCACMTSSIESAITSRLTRDARIPSEPIAIPSDTAIVRNSRGVPPAVRTPSFTFRPTRSRCI